MSILTIIALAAAGTFIPGVGIAIAIYKFGKDAVLGALKAAAKYLFLHPMTAAAIAAGLFGVWQLIERHKAEAKIPTLMSAIAKERQAFLLERKAFATTKDSLDRANGEIADNNARIKAAADELAREQAQAAADEARNARRAKSTDAEIEALQSAATDPKRKPCTLSDEAKKALGDL